MRILLLTSEYPPYSWGGLGRYSNEVYQELRRVYNIDVVNMVSYSSLRSSEENKDDSEEVFSGSDSKIVHIENNQLIELFGSRNALISGRCKRIARTLADKIIRILNKKYDIIFVQDYYNSLIAAFLLMDDFVRKMVATVHLPVYAGFTYFDKPVSDEFHQYLETILLRFSSRVIVPSQFTKMVLIQVHNVDPDKIVVNHPGVRLIYDGSKNLGEAYSPANSKYEDKVRIISVVRFTEQKGLHWIVDIIRELKNKEIDFIYTIVGKGPREEQFYDLVDKYSTSSYIHHVRDVNLDDIYNFYKTSNICISVSSYETFGLSILEAMAYGCIPIVFNIGAFNEIIQDGVTGLLVKVNQTEEIIKYISDFSENQCAYSTMKNNAIEFAGNMSWAKHAKMLGKVFEECLS